MLHIFLNFIGFLLSVFKLHPNKICNCSETNLEWIFAEFYTYLVYKYILVETDAKKWTGQKLSYKWKSTISIQLFWNLAKINNSWVGKKCPANQFDWIKNCGFFDNGLIFGQSTFFATVSKWKNYRNIQKIYVYIFQKALKCDAPF